jgi:hypothetical protein
LRSIERELAVIDRTEAKRKSVWKVAQKQNVDKQTLNSIKRAYSTEELETLKESFSPSEGKKSKLLSAMENGLAALGAAIVTDNITNIMAILSSYDSSRGTQEEILEGGIIIAAEAIFRNYDQVTKIN